jgi:adenosylcobinamide-GDP ribazoletransferase
MQFLTRLPAPAWVGHDADRLDRATRYFPLVGALVGTIAAAVWLVAGAVLPALAAAGLAVAATVLVTGAFHEDGLADTFDGVGGGLTRESALEIMRDSRLGTYGGAALGLSLILRIAALSAFGPLAGAAALVCAHSAGRTAVVATVRFARYARSEGLAKPVADRLRKGEWPFALATGALACLVAGPAGILALAAAFLAGSVMLRVLQRKLGGYTGDGLGAIEQIGEIAALVALAALFA